MVHALLEPLRSEIGRRALLEVVLLGAICGPIGFWITSFRLTYGAESLAHGMLPGLVAAALLGAPLLGGAAAGVAVAAVLIAALAGEGRTAPDTATAVVVTGLLGLGVVLALSPQTPQRLEDVLFGDPLAVSDGDLLAAAALAVGGGAALVALHRPLAVAALDPEGAAALRVRPGLARAGVLALTAVAVAVAVQGLGNLLVLAVLIAPAAAVRRHAGRPGRALLAAAAVAVIGGVVGIEVSYRLGSAAGASVALALCGAAVLGAALPLARLGRL